MTDTSKYRPFSGAWLRFSEYELRAGYVRPAPGALLEPAYDVWAEFEEARRQKRKLPWESFIALARPPLDYDSPDTASRVVSWCNKWGLPGLLFARVRRVALPPRWCEEPECAEQMIYTAIPGGWKELPVELHSLYDGDDWRPAGELAEDNDLRRLNPHGWPNEPPGVEIRQDTVLGDWVRGDLRGWWSDFFPDVPETEAEFYPYPLPLSHEFWHLYGEWPADIVYTAWLLRSTAALLAGDDVFKNGEAPSEQVQRGIDYLETLLEPAHLGVRQRDGQWWQTWYSSSSLVGYMALMIYRNITEGPGGIRLCEAKDCRTPFATKTALDHYCSTTCRNRVNTQRYRKKH